MTRSHKQNGLRDLRDPPDLPLEAKALDRTVEHESLRRNLISSSSTNKKKDQLPTCALALCDG